MNLWVLSFATLLLLSILFDHVVVGNSVAAPKIPVCSLDEMRRRIKKACEGPTGSSKKRRRRRKRSYSDGRIKMQEPNYYFRVKRDEVEGICCTSSLINSTGRNCVERYRCI